jgi:hypothetical protein
MKRNLITVLFFLVGFVAMAQTPQKFNYQAVARDKNGQPLANQQVAIEIIIKQNNNAVFTEKQTSQTNDFGLITLEIGSKTPLSTIIWSKGSLTMDVKIDPNGGSNFELLGTIQLLAVPYALYAERANEQQRLKLDNNKLSIVDSGGASEVTLPTSGTGTGDNWGTQTVTTTPILSGKGTSADPLSIAPQGAVNGQFLKWNGSTWVPGTITANGDNWGTQTVETSPVLKGKGTSADPLSIAPQGAVNGQVLQWNGTTWVPGTINISGGDGWGNQVAKTNTATITGDGSATNPLNLANNAVTSDKIVDGGIQGVDINQMNATDGQVLKWLNNSWQPANDNASGTGGAATYSGINGINVNNTTNVISLNPLSITGNSLSIQGQSGNVDLSKYMDNTDSQILTFDAATNELSISGGNKVTIPTGTGSTSVTTNTTLSGNGTAGSPLSIAPQNAVSGQVLKWNGTTWAPANDATSTGGTTYTQGTGISISGSNVISNTGDTNASDDITTTSTAGGDVNGTFSTLSVNRLQGKIISAANPADGQVLTFNGVQWIPQTPATSGTTYTAGTGISITGNTIVNTGVTSTSVGQDLSGTLPNPSVIGLRNIPISSIAPNSGQVLTYNGSQWIPQTPTTGGSSLWTEYTRGTEQGIVSNSQVVKIGGLGGLTLRPDGIRIPECPPTIFCVLDGFTTIGTGSIEVQGASSSTSPVAIFGGRVTAGSLNVGNVTSTGNISATGTANVTGNVTVGGNATITGNATVAGDLNVKSRVYIGMGNMGNGNVITYSPNGVKLASIEGQGTGAGSINIWNSSGTGKAGMFLNSSGQGLLYADVKNFKVPHPTKKDKDIWYASLEGPEAAMYERGTATLNNGETFISYSETFGLMLSPNTATVNLTPQYWDTFGLAVIEKNDKGFRVKELKGGTGNFKFDWEVKGVRKGYEDYQVVRDKEDNQSEKSESSIKDEPLRDGLPEKAKVDDKIKN